MKSRIFTFRIILFLLFIIANSCNRYLDVVKNKSDVPVKQGSFEFYSDSNLLIYKSNVILTRDTEKIYPKSFTVRLPKKLRYYEFVGSSDFALYYDGGQVIFIKVDLENKEPTKDTVCTPSPNQLNEFIQSNLSTGNGKYDIKKISFYTGRKNTIIKKGGATILLYNIYPKDYDQFFDDVNKFRVIN
ncbi:hypothetical protein FRZ67_19025 [Panacibacter ginsenosidivorans]|uniref:Uncharacterized protein n=1 Tax=Panacibacter ginsenosidivorans TaxID=1813871 RepID=A0A5B8VFI0_9BACT|nr:hypothetical protein [Panacibacter ginsenosidivorans]QEC69296.1 hypothetical protein FRZ67_19025 [Panacibacter ginsenosidivorans]